MPSPASPRFRWATNLIPFGSGLDRFAHRGYRPTLLPRERILAAAAIRGLAGVELHYPDMFADDGVEGIATALRETGLRCAIVSPTISREEFRAGALTHPDRRIRSAAITCVKEAMDVAAQLGANQINLWPGRDGHDYSFQTDYRAFWDLFGDSLAECADHNPGVRICVEYKAKEPRVYVAVGGVGILLYVLQRLNRPNVGGLLDVGHAFLARETPAESAVLLGREGRLFHVHFNDTPGDWDWDLVVGSSHTLEFVELLYWLRETGYDGWYSLDLYPSGEEPARAIQLSIEAIEQLAVLIDQFDPARLRHIFANRNALEAQAMWQGILHQRARVR